MLGSVLTAAACKPMFALCGAMRLALGTSACAAWLAAAKARRRWLFAGCIGRCLGAATFAAAVASACRPQHCLPPAPQVLDRFVKGLREAPSKALIGELAAQSGDSAAGAFALRHALSTAGMLLGAAASALAFKLSGGSYEATFVLSALPAALGALLVAAALRGGGEGGGAQPSAAGRSAAGASAAAAPSSGGSGQKGAPPRWGALGALLGALSPGYWQALAVCCLLHLARYDVSWRAVHASSVST